MEKHQRTPDWGRLATGILQALDQEEPTLASLDEEIGWLREHLAPATDLVVRPLTLADRSGALLYLSSFIDVQSMMEIGEILLNPLQGMSKPITLTNLQQLLPLGQIKELVQQGKVLETLLRGDAVLLIDGESRALGCRLKAGAHRQIEEPKTEFVLRGSREGFIEDLETNLSLLRRRLPHPALKSEELNFGYYTRTRVCLVYLQGEASPELLADVHQRLARVFYRGVLEGTYLEEAIEDSWLSPFPQVQHSERPDMVVGALLEGRVALLIDGAPAALVLPTTLIQFLSSPEDQYLRYNIATFGRWLRFTGIITALVLPALYVLITEYHVREILPEPFLLTLAGSHENIPLSISLETFIMSLIFDFIWQAGLRTPQPLGMAVSVVGALVIGQATVRAGIFSAPTIVVVSLSAILSLLSPSFDALIANRILVYPLLLLASTLGPFGFASGLILLLIHLVSLRSFGKPYFSPISPFRLGDFRDVLFRLPHPFAQRSGKR